MVLFVSCDFGPKDDESFIMERPNILWIVAEDLSPVIPSFGDSTVHTPHLSRLAKEGVCYDRVFSTSGVCAPSRAAIATGMYPTRFGANHMRTGPWFVSNLPASFIESYAKNAMPPGIKPYQAVPPTEARMMSEYLRQAGYYCSNNAKEDYQFTKGLMAWDESGTEAHWKHRNQDQPFFSVFNINVTHESQIWAKANDPLLVDGNLEVPIPPYLPSTDSAMIDIRRMYSNIIAMDNKVGEILGELEADGLLDNTIVFWCTDHGGPLPRQKRLTYDSGLRVPMIVRYPKRILENTRDTSLVSFVDFAPTMLSIAGILPPRHMDGIAFLGEFIGEKRTYIHAAGDRFDEGPSDRIRAVRDHRYKLISYYDQELPMFYKVDYREHQAIMRELRRLKITGELNANQSLWFRDTKPEIELFDTHTDPYELHNLADDPAYDLIKTRLQRELDRWLNEEEDLNMIPEPELIEKFTENGEMKRTISPKLHRKNNEVTISCATNGASIGYRLSSDTTRSEWQLYKEPIVIDDSVGIEAVAHRLGYMPSGVVGN